MVDGTDDDDDDDDDRGRRKEECFIRGRCMPFFFLQIFLSLNSKETSLVLRPSVVAAPYVVMELASRKQIARAFETMFVLTISDVLVLHQGNMF